MKSIFAELLVSSAYRLVFCKETLIPIPPSIEIQHRIITRITAILTKVKEADKCLESMQRDFKHIMNTALIQTIPNPTTDLPSHWGKVTLKDIGTVTGEGTPSKSVPDYWDGSIPWVTPKDMKHYLITDSKEHITYEGLKNSAAKLIEKESIVIVFRSGILAHSLPVAINRVPITVNQDLKAIQPRSNYNSYYIAYALRRLSANILLNCVKKGATVHSLESSKFWSYYLPIPFKEDTKQSLRSQEQIVFYLDSISNEVERSLTSIKKDIGKLFQFEQSLLEYAFLGEL